MLGTLTNNIIKSCQSKPSSSFLDFNLGKIKFVSQSIDFNEHLMRAIRTSGSMRNSMPFESARISSYQLINHIYSRKVMVEQ